MDNPLESILYGLVYNARYADPKPGASELVAKAALEIRALPPSTGAPDLAEALDAVEKAEVELAHMIRAHFEGKPSMRCSIPANPSRDSDLILTTGLHKAREVLAALLGGGKKGGDLREAEARIEEVEGVARYWADVAGYLQSEVNAARKAGFVFEGGKREGVPPPKTGAVPSGQGIEAALSRFPTMPPEDPGATYYLPRYEGRGSICRYCRKVLSEHYDMLCPIRGCTLHGPPESPSPATRSDEVAEGTPRHDLLSELYLRGAVKSFGEARRLIANGAVSANGEKMTDANLSDQYSYELAAIRVGKRDYPAPSNGEAGR
jgi:hypothetical protein